MVGTAGAGPFCVFCTVPGVGVGVSLEPDMLVLTPACQLSCVGYPPGGVGSGGILVDWEDPMSE